MADKLSNIYRVQISAYQNYTKSSIIVSRTDVHTLCPLHWHDHYELEYVIAGHGEHIMNGVHFPICPGSLHFMTLTDFHELIPDGNTISIIKLSFQESDINPSIFRMLPKLAENLHLQLEGEEKEQFDSIFTLALKQRNLFSDTSSEDIIVKNLTECILLNVVDYCRKNEKLRTEETSEDSDMHRLLTYIHGNFRSHITLRSVAEYARFSPNYLSRMFHQTVGTTFKEYVTKLRIDYAARLIRNTQASITEICFESGFGSLSNFIREFKKLYLISPSEYRAQNKKQDF